MWHTESTYTTNQKGVQQHDLAFTATVEANRLKTVIKQMSTQACVFDYLYATVYM